jgi:hypothetical protein
MQRRARDDLALASLRRFRVAVNRASLRSVGGAACGWSRSGHDLELASSGRRVLWLGGEREQPKAIKDEHLP